MPLVTRALKGGLISHEEQDANLLLLKDLADTAQEAADQAVADLAGKASLTADNVLDGIQAFGKAVFQKTAGELAAANIDVSAGSHFKKTVAGGINFAVTGVPVAGKVASFILDLTNGGAFAVTWWANIKWAGGTAPTLTAAGRDVLGFYTVDGGATWTGMVLAKDAK